MNEQRVLNVSDLPDACFGTHSLIWWGQLGMAVIEGAMFLMVIAAYLFIRLQFAAWPPPGNNIPALWIPTINVIVLLISTVPMHIGDKAVLKKNWPTAIIATAISVVLGFVYLALRIVVWRQFNFAWDSNLYGSIVYLTLGVHTMHVIGAQVETIVLIFLPLVGKRDDRVRQGLNVDEIYWYFVVIAGVLLYLVIFVSPLVI